MLEKEGRGDTMISNCASKNKKQTKQTKGGKKNNIFIRCWEWGWGGIFSAPDLFTLLLFYSLYLLKTCIKK